MILYLMYAGRVKAMVKVTYVLDFLFEEGYIQNPT
jgi:hypothetical protein